MKRFSFIAFTLCFVSLGLIAQTKKETKIVVASTNMNILYRGMDNPISIACPGISDDKIYAEVTRGKAKLTKIGEADYILNVEYGSYELPLTMDVRLKDGTIIQKDTVVQDENNIIDIYVYAKINGKNVYLNQTSFRVKDIPKVSADINNNDGGLIDKETLLKKPFVNVEVEDFDFPVKYKVIYFMMAFLSDKDQAPLISKDERFTKEMIEKIKSLKKGEKFVIEAIRVKGPDGEKQVSNPAIIYTIK